MKIFHVRFMASAARPDQFPQESRPEIAFAGRSNVGKSSLINKLLGKEGIAKTSSKPGRTRAVNFIEVNQGAFRFVDLPGYGWAKVSRSMRQHWQYLVEKYLENRKCLKGVILILDIRREKPSDMDMQLIEYIDHLKLPCVVALTKADKLKSSQRQRNPKLIKEALGRPNMKFVVFSAKTGEGKAELWKELNLLLRKERVQ